MRDAFWDLGTGSCCLGCGQPGRLLCRGCRAALPGDQVFLAGPDPPPPGLVPVLAATEYGGVVRRMILRHKEDQAFTLAAPLGTVLAASLAGILRGWPADTRAVVVPVPSLPAAVRRRGHDPLLRIVRAALAEVPGSPELARVLCHRGRVADQGGLDAAARAVNLRGAFTVDARRLRQLARRPGPVAAVICDDVITTGATARESQRALERAGVPVAAVAVLAATRLRRRAFS